MARPMTVGSAPALAKASHTAVPRTPDAPWEKKNTEAIGGSLGVGWHQLTCHNHLHRPERQAPLDDNTVSMSPGTAQESGAVLSPPRHSLDWRFYSAKERSLLLTSICSPPRGKQVAKHNRLTCVSLISPLVSRVEFLCSLPRFTDMM